MEIFAFFPTVYVVGVVGAAADMVRGHEDAVEVGVGADDGILVVVLREDTCAELVVEVLADDSLDDAQGVVGALVEVVPDLLEDVVGHVVGGIAGDDVC